MPFNLVNYSDSSSDEEIEEAKSLPIPKSKLPNPFGKPSDATNTEDDKDEHNGKTRNFPHERGNWATYVYVQYPSTDMVTKLQDELLELIKSASTFESVQIHKIDELHLSLTRTVILQHHWIDEFVQSVEQSVKNSSRFSIDLNSIQIYCNDNETRTFISLSFVDTNSKPKQNLQNIVRKLDSCLEEFKLPPFYEEASFHVSLLWCLGDKRNELQVLLPQFFNLLERVSAEDNSNFLMNIDQLFCKIGNKLYSFRL